MNPRAGSVETLYLSDLEALRPRVNCVFAYEKDLVPLLRVEEAVTPMLGSCVGRSRE